MKPRRDYSKIDDILRASDEQAKFAAPPPLLTATRPQRPQKLVNVWTTLGSMLMGLGVLILPVSVVMFFMWYSVYQMARITGAPLSETAIIPAYWAPTLFGIAVLSFTAGKVLQRLGLTVLRRKIKAARDERRRNSP